MRRASVWSRRYGSGVQKMQIDITSFGHKYGQLEADIVLDMRCLQNPYWVPALRELSGLDEPVREYILQDRDCAAYLQTLLSLMTMQAELAARRGCERLHIAVGCTGGRHRSVTAAVLLAKRLEEEGHTVCLHHRDIERG